MYAIVKSGARQYRVAEGDVIEVNRVAGEVGDAVPLTVLAAVDGATVTTDPAGVQVQAELVAHGKGPKIVIHKFKNKTGYHKRQGHRQRTSTLRVTGITGGSGTPPAEGKAAAAATESDGK